MDAVNFRGKEDALRRWLRAHKNLAVAYSGGVDSSLLSVVAREILGDDMVAVTVDSAFLSRRDLQEAIELARQFGITHHIIREDIDEVILENTQNRCYFCKKGEYADIREYAGSRGIELVVDGMNHDDLGDYRPGAFAAKEQGVRSPLQEIGFTKNEIRSFARALGLPNWAKPANACLASRIIVDEQITLDKLNRIEAAEDFLHDLGIRHLRVRNHGDLARIEVNSTEMEKFFNEELMNKVNVYFKKVGFKFVPESCTVSE